MSEEKLTRVVAVSDRAIYLRGLASLVMTLKNVTLIGEARSKAEALQLCQMSVPEMVIVSLKETVAQRREFANHIHHHWPAVKVILLVEQQDEPPVHEETDDWPLFCMPDDLSEEEFTAAFEHIQNGAGWEDDLARHGNAHDEEAGEKEFQQTLELVQNSSPHRSEELLTRELVMAGKIQADILPEVAPTILGWDISVKLVPARETSGDFYDFIPLTDRKLGVVVADVTDKGMGAALFMALSSTLIRTFSTRFPTLPALALSAVSERILTDTRGSTFVTTFFGILEPFTGRFIYANAGHPPGFLISEHRGKQSIERLRPTGMALGVSEQARWKQKVVKLNPGDFVILYTDGITEAQNPQGQFFEEDRLLDVALSKVGCTAREIQDALLEEVRRFVGNNSPQDDIALVVIRREE